MSLFQDMGQKNVIVSTVKIPERYVYWDVGNIVLCMCLIVARHNRQIIKRKRKNRLVFVNLVDEVASFYLIEKGLNRIKLDCTYVNLFIM
jgi:hypothetical protein